MPCEHYKDALIEVAASGAAPQGELRAHLDGCASCHAAFAEEQSLFSTIDSSLHASANAEVPSSLLPRVRIALCDAVIVYPRWNSSWFALAGAALAAAAVLLAVTTRQNHPRPTSTNLAVNRAPAPQIVPAEQGDSHSTLPKKENLGPKLPAYTARNSGQSVELASHKPTTEILVPRDQEILLATYAQQWDSRKHPPVLAGEVDQKAAALLEISPIQITELDVKPLAEEDLQ